MKIDPITRPKGPVKYSRYAYWLIVAVFASWNVYQNSLFSANLAESYLRTVDDMAMQEIFSRMHSELRHGELLKFLNHTEYAYGWLFWLVYSLSGLPAFILNELGITEIAGVSVEAILIQAPRNLALILTLFTAHVIRVLVRDLSTAAWSRAYLETVLPAIYLAMPTVGYLAGRPQPPALSNFLILVALRKPLVSYFRNQLLNRSSVAFTAVALGAAVGVKTTAVFIFPLVVLVLLAHIQQYARVHGFFRTPGYFCALLLMALGGFVVATSPYWAINILSTNESKRVVDNLFFFTKLSTRSTGDSWVRGISGFFEGTFHPAVFVLVIVAFASMKRNRSSVRPSNMINRHMYLLLAQLLAVAVVLRVVTTSTLQEQSYNTVIMPFLALTIGLPWLVGEKSRLLANLKPLLILIILASTISSGFSTTPGHLSYFINWNNPATKAALVTGEEMKVDVPLEVERITRIIQTASGLFPPVYSRTNSNVYLALTYDDFSDIAWFTNPDYIIVANDLSRHPELAFFENDLTFDSSLYPSSPLLKLFSTSEFGDQECDQLLIRTSYVVFKCEPNLNPAS